MEERLVRAGDCPHLRGGSNLLKVPGFLMTAYLAKASQGPEWVWPPGPLCAKCVSTCRAHPDQSPFPISILIEGLPFLSVWGWRAGVGFNRAPTHPDPPCHVA